MLYLVPEIEIKNVDLHLTLKGNNYQFMFRRKWRNSVKDAQA